MPRFCAIINCGNRAERDAKSFYRLPVVLSKRNPEKARLSKLRRQKWLYMIRRQDLTEAKLKWLFVCQDHFISGKPAELTDTENPDWVPSLNLGYVCDNEDDNEGKKRKRLSKDIKSEENSQSSKVNMDNYEILFNDVINPKKENLDDTTYTETAHNSSHSVCEDVSDCDPLTYYMHGLNKFSYPSCDVTHENALQSAKTLLMYMESQNDTDLADIVIIRRYMRKIKDKIKVTER